MLLIIAAPYSTITVFLMFGNVQWLQLEAEAARRYCGQFPRLQIYQNLSQGGIFPGSVYWVRTGTCDKLFSLPYVLSKPPYLFVGKSGYYLFWFSDGIIPGSVYWVRTGTCDKLFSLPYVLSKPPYQFVGKRGYYLFWFSDSFFKIQMFP